MDEFDSWKEYAEKEAEEHDRKVPDDVRKLIGQMVNELEELQASLAAAERNRRKGGRGASKVNALRKQATAAEARVCGMLEPIIQFNQYLTLPNGRKVNAEIIYDEKKKKQPRSHLRFF